MTSRPVSKTGSIDNVTQSRNIERISIPFFKLKSFRLHVREKSCPIFFEYLFICAVDGVQSVTSDKIPPGVDSKCYQQKKKGCIASAEKSTNSQSLGRRES
jgi:hypothetical protein